MKATAIEISSTAFGEDMKHCMYDRVGVGPCGSPKADGSEFCQKHANERCCVCGAQATRECNRVGLFALGAPLCDNCMEYYEPGRHHRKKIKGGSNESYSD